MVGDKLLSFQWGVKKIRRNQAIQGKRKTCAKAGLFSDEILCGEPDKTQSEHPPQYKTAFFLQQLTFPQSAILARLSNKR